MKTKKQIENLLFKKFWNIVTIDNYWDLIEYTNDDWNSIINSDLSNFIYQTNQQVIKQIYRSIKRSEAISATSIEKYLEKLLSESQK